MKIPYLRLIGSKGWDTWGDCGICAVGTLCSKPYEDVVAVAERLGYRWKGGLWGTQMVKMAAEFGVTLKKKRKYDIEESTGLLMINTLEPYNGKRIDHVVVLDEGRVLDCDLTVWQADAYIQHYKAKLGELLVLE